MVKKDVCRKCGKETNCKYLVLSDYSSVGNWVVDGMYCSDCEDAIAEFMGGNV